MNKPTLIIGASENPERYSNKAALSLKKHGYTIYLIGNKVGQIEGININVEKIDFKNIDTVTLYLNKNNQANFVAYIYSLNPKRIIFNPGAENPEFYNEATKKGIECVEGCTLVMLSIGNY